MNKISPKNLYQIIQDVGKWALWL